VSTHRGARGSRRLSDSEGLLLQPQHLAPRADTGPPELVSRALMAAFVRCLVRSTSNADLLWLTLHQARVESEAPAEEVEALVEAIRAIRATRGTPWPKGFFEEF